MEIWRDVIWYEWLYQVSNLGRVKSLDKRVFQWRYITEVIRKWKIRKLQTRKDWFIIVRLVNKDWKFKGHIVSRLVISAFKWESDLDVTYADWNKNNIRLNNLYYKSRSQIAKDAYKKWTRKPSFNNKWKFFWDSWNSKSVKQYDLKWNFIKTWDSIKRAETELKLFNISRSINKGGIAWGYKWIKT